MELCQEISIIARNSAPKESTKCNHQPLSSIWKNLKDYTPSSLPGAEPSLIMNLGKRFSTSPVFTLGRTNRFRLGKPFDLTISRPEMRDSPRTVSTGESPLEKTGGNNLFLVTQMCCFSNHSLLSGSGLSDAPFLGLELSSINGLDRNTVV